MGTSISFYCRCLEASVFYLGPMQILKLHRHAEGVRFNLGKGLICLVCGPISGVVALQRCSLLSLTLCMASSTPR